MSFKTNSFFPIITVCSVAETNNDTLPGMDLVVQFFMNLVPALLMLAIISILFGFISHVTRLSNVKYVKLCPTAVIITAIIVATVLPLHTISSSLSLYYFDIDSEGLYIISDAYVYDVFDAYGNKPDIYVIEESDWHPTGYIMYLSPGRYYAYLGEPGSFPPYTADLDISYTYSAEYLNLVGEERDEQHSLVYSSQNYIYLRLHYKSETLKKDYILFDTNVYIIENTVFNVTIETVYYEILYGGDLEVAIVVDDQTKAKFDFPSSGSNVTKAVDITAGYHRIVIKTVSNYEPWYKNADFYVYINCTYIANIDIPVEIALQPAANVDVSSETQKYKVYAHNFTITSNDTQLLKYFIVPVYTAEVEQLTSLNPAVIQGDDIVRPAQLVDLGIYKYIVFQSWCNSTVCNYTVVWNYPQTTSVGIFYDSFTSDPLFTWNEIVKENVSLVTYDPQHDSLNVTFNATGLYIMSRTIDFNASALYVEAEADYLFAHAGSSNLTIVTYPYTTALYYVEGVMYDISIVEDSSTLSMHMERLTPNISYSYGNTIAVGVEGNGTGVIHGVIALPIATAYNVTVNKQLLRLDLEIERYSIGYSVPSAIGYWTHMVQCTIYYDPAYLPPTPYFNVVLELPENEWVAQGLARPGLVDIAVVDSSSNLIPFWIEPFMSNGYRRVWLKLPADPSRNIYVVNILLNNTRITTTLSTYNAFIEFYRQEYGLGTTWVLDDYGYVVTQNPYVNTIVAVTDSLTTFSFKLGYTVYDYYIVSPYSIVEVHGSYTSEIHSFSGFYIENQVQWIYYDQSGNLRYYQGSSLVWEVSDLDKPWTWPPTIIGAKNAEFIGLAVLVPYSYAIGTVTGGWAGIESEPVVVNDDRSGFSWESVGQMMIVMMPLIIIALVMKLIQNPPSIARSRRGGVL